MDLVDYQRRAAAGAEHKRGVTAAPRAACGLAAAAGAVAATIRDQPGGALRQQRHAEVLRRELGVLLCSAAAVATAAGLDLEDVASASLRRLGDLNGLGTEANSAPALPVFDAGCPPGERFPRRLVVDFRQRQHEDGRPVVETILSAAEPHPANRPTSHNSPRQGVQIGVRIGDPLTDNARSADGYRFHDAIHLGFLANLGWSPNLRALLKLKRKSNLMLDECEDGARAIFAEEGLAAVLARLAEERNGFHTYRAVTHEVVDVARAATVGLEVHELPGWLWRRAIWQGFRAMHHLILNSGGRLVTDLDARNLTYRRIPGRRRQTTA